MAAVILQTYRVYDNAKATEYLNFLGQAPAMASDLPVTYSSYHLLILDANDIDAFGCPSGFVLVTRSCSGPPRPKTG